MLTTSLWRSLKSPRRIEMNPPNPVRHQALLRTATNISRKSARSLRNLIPWRAALILAILSGIATFMVRRANASASDDASAVAALDKQYQAAVEKNDAATMDRILDDN